MAQIALPLDWANEANARFIVSSSNEAAARLIEQWRDWPVRTALLAGPPRSGRSTLGHIFAQDSGGEVIDGVDANAEDALFHAWNRAEANGRPLLLIADRLPPAWSVTLPDLRSRLAASPAATIEAPDDRLVPLLIEEAFARRHVDARQDVVAWLAARVERSHAAVLDAVAAIDSAAAATRRRPTVSLARHVLGL